MIVKGRGERMGIGRYDRGGGKMMSGGEIVAGQL